jgi:hypothetical protein
MSLRASARTSYGQAWSTPRRWWSSCRLASGIGGSTVMEGTAGRCQVVVRPGSRLSPSSECRDLARPSPFRRPSSCRASTAASRAGARKSPCEALLLRAREPPCDRAVAVDFCEFEFTDQSGWHPAGGASSTHGTPQSSGSGGDWPSATSRQKPYPTRWAVRMIGACESWSSSARRRSLTRPASVASDTQRRRKSPATTARSATRHPARRAARRPAPGTARAGAPPGRPARRACDTSPAPRRA